LRLAEEACRQLQLGGVIWLPTGQPRHRTPPLADSAQRLTMVQLATAGHPNYQVDATEARSATPSFTVPSLERLRAVHGAQRPLVLLMGADAFLGLASWHRWRELFGLAHVAVASRPTFPLAATALDPALGAEFRQRHTTKAAALASAPAGAIVTFPLAAGTVSATEVRAKLRDRQAVDALLPPAVLDYIRRHRLYLP
jgi:nicotinate-nucleotide adenylyltransferase